MVIILILVVLWGVVLAPGLLRRVKSQASVSSIDSFHHSLHLLERSGPKLVEPAYRLVGEAGEVTEATSRPRLVLLRPLGQEGEPTVYEDHEDSYDDERYERYYYPEEAAGFGASLPPDAYGRRMAARRRRDILLALGGAVLATAIFGFLAPFFYWLTLLSALLLVGYVGLMSYAALRGDIGGSSTLRTERHDDRYGDERLVARGVVDHRFDDEVDDDWDDASYDDDRHDDGWWDEPRRAVGR